MKQLLDSYTFDRLVQSATLSADIVAMESYPNEAQRTRAIIRRALECCISNGMLEVVPSDQWPQWISLDPAEGFDILDRRVMKGGPNDNASHQTH